MQAMKQNFDNNPTLKWQYFGGEDGIMSIFPSNYACDNKFDPRFRQVHYGIFFYILSHVQKSPKMKQASTPTNVQNKPLKYSGAI